MTEKPMLAFDADPFAAAQGRAPLRRGLPFNPRPASALTPLKPATDAAPNTSMTAVVQSNFRRQSGAPANKDQNDMNEKIKDRLLAYLEQRGLAEDAMEDVQAILEGVDMDKVKEVVADWKHQRAVRHAALDGKPAPIRGGPTRRQVEAREAMFGPNANRLA